MNELAELLASGTVEKPDVAGAVSRLTVTTADVVRAFDSRANVPIVATFANGYATRTSLMPRRGAHILPLNKEVCEAAGIAPGDRVSVTLRADNEPRALAVPPDLGVALDEAHLRERFDALSFSCRKEWTAAIDAAKRAETHAKRIGECIAALCASGARRTRAQTSVASVAGAKAVRLQ